MLGILMNRFTPLLAPVWKSLPERAQMRILWLLNAKFPVGVTGIVFDDAGRVMLLKHTFRRRYPWGLVSGWVKRGETLEDALRREVREETSLSVHIEQLFRVQTDPLGCMMEVIYLCRLAGGTFRPSQEVTELRWQSADTLPPGLHVLHVPLIQAALARMPNMGPSARPDVRTTPATATAPTTDATA